MADIRILLAGESWVSNSTHFKGWDYFSSTVYEVGTEALERALKVDGLAFEHLPGHLAAARFPQTRAELERYDVIILSDLGANTLLLHPDTWLRGQPTPNRLKLLAGWVEDGGGLAMCGGYMSFAGINAAAKYYRTPIETVLPVQIHPFDDRLEVPEGVRTVLTDPAHPVVAGIEGEWPLLLGHNELVLKPDAHLVAAAGEHPLLAVRKVGRGRTLAWTSDIGPHWCPAPFLAWPGYARLWQNVVRWLAGRTESGERAED